MKRKMVVAALVVLLVALALLVYLSIGGDNGVENDARRATPAQKRSPPGPGDSGFDPGTPD